MKVSKLVELLKTENQDAEIFVCVHSYKGFKVVEIGQKGGAVIGKGVAEDGRPFVLLPIECPTQFEPWEE